MVTEEVMMVKNIEELLATESYRELEEFAKYLGVDFEDYLEHLHPDVDFDDFSR